MQNDNTPKGIIQGLIFNIVIFIGFTALIINYIFPEYKIIEGKKDILIELQQKEELIKSNGLNFDDFYKILLKRNDVDILKNKLNEKGLEDFRRVYELNLVNNSKKSYDNFISEKKKEILKAIEKTEKNNIVKKINTILPTYSEDGTLVDTDITDFKFVNYIEQLIYSFSLDYKGNIGIGNLKLVENLINDDKKKNLEGEIYSFILPLELTGKKRNIIDFVYYIENVGNISFKEKQLNTKEEKDYDNITLNKYIKDSSFPSMNRYFHKKDNIFNNIMVNINSIKMKEYINSSTDFIEYENGDRLVNFLKENQGNEKYSVNIVLEFYVKGAKKTKLLGKINEVNSYYIRIKKHIISGIKFGEKNKTKLNDRSIYSLLKLKKYNKYLLNIDKDIKILTNKEKIKENLKEIYTKAINYEKVFLKIDIELESSLKDLSEDLYEKYKNIKTKKKEEND